MITVSQFTPGQVWAYQTRLGEEDSRITILRVDETEHAGVLVHVAIEGVNLPNPIDPSRPNTSIGFMPMAEASLAASVTQLVTTDISFTPPLDFEEGYVHWKLEFNRGKAGFWTVPVAQVVQALDDALKKAR